MATAAVDDAAEAAEAAAAVMASVSSSVRAHSTSTSSSSSAVGRGAERRRRKADADSESGELESKAAPPASVDASLEEDSGDEGIDVRKLAEAAAESRPLRSSSLPSTSTSSSRRRRRRRHAVESLALTPKWVKFEKFILRQTRQFLYVVASDRLGESWHVLKIDRTVAKPEKLEDIVMEDPAEYSREEMGHLLHMIDSGNPDRIVIGRGYGLLGFVRFLTGYYLVLITGRSRVGVLGGHRVYTIKSTKMIAIHQPEQRKRSLLKRLSARLAPDAETLSEERYKSLFGLVDLTKDFFFSYTYDLSNTLQSNLLRPKEPVQSMFMWNQHLMEELQTFADSRWVLPVQFGFFEQRSCSIIGRLLRVTLIARRSRHYAGTRYLKRGVNDDGKVANDVEVEQLVNDIGAATSFEGNWASFVQNRGSIPVFWTQITSAAVPRPPILLSRSDPTYTATRKHFEDMFHRYSKPVLVLNLVKQQEKQERETIIGYEFKQSVSYLNDFLPEPFHIQYEALDFTRIAKDADRNVLSILGDLADWTLDSTNFFAFKDGEVLLKQEGVLRTNCVDCLDRTNVAQFWVGLVALGSMLHELGIYEDGKLESDSEVITALMDMYERMGDHIALQYGGSLAHKKVKKGKSSDSRVSGKGKHKEIVTSIRRFYSNSFVDGARQAAMNLFLGVYRPLEQSEPLWEMHTDYFLHHNVPLPNTTFMPQPRWWQVLEAPWPRIARPALYLEDGGADSAADDSAAAADFDADAELAGLDTGGSVGVVELGLSRDSDGIISSASRTDTGWSSLHGVDLLNLYRPDEPKTMTSFDKELGYAFSRPVEVSAAKVDESPRTRAPGWAAAIRKVVDFVTKSPTSDAAPGEKDDAGRRRAYPIMPSAEDERSMSLYRTYIHTARAICDGLVSKDTLRAREAHYEASLRVVSTDVKDARAARLLQVRFGATRTLRTGPYKGYKQGAPAIVYYARNFSTRFDDPRKTAELVQMLSPAMLTTTDCSTEEDIALFETLRDDRLLQLEERLEGRDLLAVEPDVAAPSRESSIDVAGR